MATTGNIVYYAYNGGNNRIEAGGAYTQYTVTQPEGAWPTSPHRVKSAALTYSMRAGNCTDVGIIVQRNDGSSDTLGTVPSSNPGEITWSLSEDADYVDITGIVLKGNGGYAGQLAANTGITLTVTWELTTTACIAPTSVTLSSAVAETSATLNWSGAKAGTGNAIKAYFIQTRESGDGTTWGGWMNYKTVTATSTSGSAEVYAPTVRGSYRQFRVKTQGTSGTSYDSAYAQCAGSLRKNAAPTAPTAVTLSTTSPYETEPFTLSWHASTDATGTIDHYLVRSRTSPDNAAWSSWADTKISATTSSSLSPALARGAYVQYAVCAVDNFGVASDFGYSATLRKNTAPNAPASLSATPAVFESQNVTLTWPAATDAAGTIASYRLRFRTKTASTWSDWVDLAATTARTYAHAAYAAVYRGTAVQYAVCAVDNFGVASGYTSSSVVYRNALPTTPTGLTADVGTVFEADTITLRWNASTDATDPIDHYTVQQRTNSNGTWSDWAAVKTTADTTAAMTPSLARGASIQFAVYAVDSLSQASGTIATAALRKNTAPTTPANLTADVTVYEATPIQLTWPASTDTTDSVARYIVECSTSSTGGSTWGSWSAVTSTTALSCTHAPSLSRGALIRYRVCGVDTFGVCSGYATSSSIRKNRLPANPTSVTATPALLGSGSVTVSWTASTDPDDNLAWYEVQRSTTGSSGAYGGWLGLPNRSGTAASDAPGITAGQSAKYRVRAVDSLGAASAWVESAAVRRNTKPTAPTNVTATPAIYESGNVTLAWTASTDVDGNLAGYRVYMQTSTDGATWGDATQLTSTTTNSATVSPTIARGTSARFLVEAYDSLDGVSARAASPVIRRNSLPKPPTILFPSAGKTCASGKPFVRFTLPPEPDGQTQTVQLRVVREDGTQAMAYTQVASVPSSGTSGMTVRCPQSLDDGAYTLSLRTLDAQGAVSSTTASVSVTVAAQTWTRPIASGTTIANESISHRADMAELLSAVNRARDYAGLTNAAYSQDVGYFARWYGQMQELQAAMDAVFALTGQGIVWATQAKNYPEAATINQIRDATNLI